MKKASATLLAMTLGLAMAAPVAHADGYGTAGCGLGSILFGDDPGIIQVLAATTNGTFGNQTFAITSGTSNCADSGGGSASAKAFIEANRESLSKDIARGQGETITNLSALAGCADEAAVGTTLQKNFSEIFPEASVNDTQVSESVLQTLKSNTALSCKLLS
ncbi:MAG: DUF3015 domain-containing protein [Myxococcales bacterium]|nr:DUF3015 domain-containing protein [Myxococcales bacterium]